MATKRIELSKSQKLSQSEKDWAKKALRYLSMENLANDFPDVAERKAMAAVFKWLGLNAVVARRLKTPGHFATHVPLKKLGRLNWQTDAVVLDYKKLERVEKLLGVEEFEP
jgi:hypothetical protein